MAGLRTEFEFTLPKGYVASDGSLHRNGVMRLATARDEIEPLRDRSIDGPDDPYLTILVLARVITRLGSLPSIGVREVEGLFAADLAFLQDLYGIINFGDQADVAALQASVLVVDDHVDLAAEPAGASEGHHVGGVGGALADETSAPLVDVPHAAPAVVVPDDDVFVTPRRTGRIEEVTRSGVE